MGCVAPSGLEILGIAKSGASRHRQRMCRAFGPKCNWRKFKTYPSGTSKLTRREDLNCCLIYHTKHIANVGHKAHVR